MLFGRRKKNNCVERDILELGIFSLDVAVAAGDLATVKQLVIDCGIDPNILSDFTSLFTALRNGHPEVVEFLLEHGIDPNIQNNNGDTLLQLAAANNYLRLVKLLLEHGADPNIQNNYGRTPLHVAAFNGRREVVKLLLEHGADPNIQENMFGQTPLHFAVDGCYVDVVRVLLDHGADPTIRDNEGMTPLDYGSDCSEEIREVLRRRSGGTTVYE